MPGSLLLALPILGGFYFATIEHGRDYRLARKDGHRFYFAVVAYALWLLFLAVGIVWLCHYGAATLAWFAERPSCSTHAYASLWSLLDAYSDSPIGIVQKYQQYRLRILLLSFFLGYELACMWNRWIPNSKHIAVLSAIDGHEFEALLLDGLREEIPILFTLRTGKIYLGWVVSTPDPRRDRKWVRILPLAAGYRDEQQHPMFVSDYTEILARVQDGEDGVNHLDIEAFEVVIAASEIDYAHMYDPQIADKFNLRSSTSQDDISESG